MNLQDLVWIALALGLVGAAVIGAAVMVKTRRVSAFVYAYFAGLVVVPLMVLAWCSGIGLVLFGLTWLMRQLVNEGVFQFLLLFTVAGIGLWVYVVTRRYLLRFIEDAGFDAPAWVRWALTPLAPVVAPIVWTVSQTTQTGAWFLTSVLGIRFADGEERAGR